MSDGSVSSAMSHIWFIYRSPAEADVLRRVRGTIGRLTDWYRESIRRVIYGIAARVFSSVV